MSKFGNYDKVKLKAIGDFKYGKLKNGEVGEVFDTFESSNGHSVYEITFDTGHSYGMNLIHEHDLELVEKAE